MPKKPIIEIQDPKDIIEEFRKQFTWLFTIVIGAMLAMLIGFITMLFMVSTMLIDVWKFREDISNERKSNEILNEQSVKISELSNSIDQIKRWFCIK